MEVALFTEVVEDSPGGGDAAARPGAGVAAGGVESRGPVFEGEALVFDEGFVSDKEARDALVGVSELVYIDGDGGDAVDGEVVVGDVISELPGEGEDEATVAGVDVAPEVVLFSEGPDVRYGVVDAVGIGGCGAGDEDGVFVDGVGHGLEIGADVYAGRDPDGLDAEDMGGLVEGRVGGVGDYDLGSGCIGLVISGPGLGGLHGYDNALGATGGDASACALGGGEHFEEGVKELAFVFDEAGKEIGGKEGVVVDVHLIGLVGYLYHVLPTEVAAALELAGRVPGFVLLVGRGHLGAHVGPGSRVSGEVGWGHGRASWGVFRGRRNDIPHCIG